MKRGHLILCIFVLFGLSTFVNSQTSLHFDGVDEYVQTSYEGMSGTDARTVSAWIKTTANCDPNNDGSQKVITDWGTQVQGGRFTFNVLWNDAIRLEVNGNGLSGAIAVNDGTWHHVAVTYDPDSANDLRLYVDGVLDVAGNLTVPINTLPSVDMQIGMRVDGVKNFEGEIDEVSIWDKALTQEELMNYSCLSGDLDQIENLVAYYNFNEGAGTTLNDLVGEYDGELMNMEEENWTLSEVCESGFNITFLITEEDGITPIEGASIELEGDVIVSDEDGSATFYYYEPGSYDYTVSKSEYYEVIGTAELVDDDLLVEVSLPQIYYYDIKFIVTEDPGGSFVEDAIVNLDGVLQYTNENGETTFENFLPGSYDYTITKEGYDLVFGDIEVVDQDITLEVSLPVVLQYYDIVFVISGEGGANPLENAEVNLDGSILYTDEIGEVIFTDYLPGEYNYIVSKDGFDSQDGIIELVDTNLTVNVNLVPTLEYYSISFVVTENGGADPVEGAEVNLDGTIQTSNANGEVVFYDYLPGEYPYDIAKEGYSLVSGTAYLEDEDLFIEIDLLISKIKHQVPGKLAIYPNPTKDIIHIEIEEIFIGKTLSLYDNEMNIISENVLAEDAISLDMSSLDLGVYFLKIITPSGVFSRKVIKVN